MQDRRPARICLCLTLKRFLNTRHAPRVISLGGKPIQVIRCHFIYRGDYLLRVSLKRGPQVGTCAVQLKHRYPAHSGSDEITHTWFAETKQVQKLINCWNKCFFFNLWWFERNRSFSWLTLIHASFHNHFNSQRSLSKRTNFKLNRAAALAEWCQLLSA